MNASLPNRGRHFGLRREGASQGGDILLKVFHRTFHKLIDRIDAGLAVGSIEARLPDGRQLLLGGQAPGPAAIVDLASWRALIRLATGGSAGWYTAWSRGEWSSPDPVALFELFVRNRYTLGDTGRPSGVARQLKRLWHWARRNHRGNARRNIQYHYDLGNDFYSLWLDPGMTYSSALFDEPIVARQSLDHAQHTKLAAILDRTGTKPGDTILEIGCGWGSFAEAAARAGRIVHGITLSSEQKRAVEARIARAGLSGVTVSLTDYRDVAGLYDAVASIEMVEAVGREYWGKYLAAIARVLKPGGRAAIQFISFDDAIFERYARSVDFIQRHVFPGGMLISERQFRALAEVNGLRWEDRRGFGMHYAETLKRWRIAFDAAVDARKLPGEFDYNFVGLWRYYLMYCEGGFRGGGIDVAQITLVKAG